MARDDKRNRGSWYAWDTFGWWTSVEKCTGPAHAVYFATYETVKHAMGGNDRSVHHPLAAGKWSMYPSNFYEFIAYVPSATSGACATIASDGLMNPFDGELPSVRFPVSSNRSR